jgi:hypothetical protein
MNTAAAPRKLLSDEQTARFRSDGFLLLRNFYDLETEIRPIQQNIHRILGMMLKNHAIDFEQQSFAPETFDAGYQELIAHDRRYGSFMYDAVKHIPPFVRLACSSKHDALLMQLRGSDMPGLPYGGFGIRIDNPFEEKFRANWHQDYPYQRCSIDGLVFWSPLISVTEEVGPLQLAVGSHHDGLRTITTKAREGEVSKPGAYSLRLYNEEEVLSKYEIIHSLMEPGDLIIIDYLVLHASGFNCGKRSRWSMQMRYFNYLDPVGQSYDWAGAVAAGQDMCAIHPGLIVDY